MTLTTLNQEIDRRGIPAMRPEYLVENNSAMVRSLRNGSIVPEWAVATFDPSASTSERSIAAYPLGVYIPSGAILLRYIVDVKTTFTSATDAATIAIHTQSADDILAAVAISTAGDVWDAGIHAGKIGFPNFGADAAHDSQVEVAALFAATYLKLTAIRQITATVAVEALTAGKANIYIEYLPGA